MGKGDGKGRNGEIPRERGEDGRDMLNGVGGLDVWWSLVVHPDESRKAPWKKRGAN